MWSVKHPVLRVALLETQVVVAGGAAPVGEPVVLPVAGPAAVGPRWPQALAALDTWLQNNPRPSCTLQVVLSTQLVRWQCLPWPRGLTQPAALHAYAQARLRETFGPVADQWAVLTATPHPGQPVLLCATDQDLLTQLQALAQNHRLHLGSTSPYFAAARDHWQHRLRRGTVWFAALEPGGLTLGLLRHGHCQGVRSVRLANQDNTDAVGALVALQQQMRVGAGLEQRGPEPVLTCGVEPPTPTAALAHTHLVPEGHTAAGRVQTRMAWGV